MCIPTICVATEPMQCVREATSAPRYDSKQACVHIYICHNLSRIVTKIKKKLRIRKELHESTNIHGNGNVTVRQMFVER